MERQIADQARVHEVPEERIVEDVILAPAAIKRLVKPSEVAEAVVYLCSSAAASVTGSAIVLDGGWTAR